MALLQSKSACVLKMGFNVIIERSLVSMETEIEENAKVQDLEPTFQGPM